MLSGSLIFFLKRTLPLETAVGKEIACIETSLPPFPPSGDSQDASPLQNRRHRTRAALLHHPLIPS